MVVKSDSQPRMGLVCKHCARCGLLVVPAALVMLPAKPKKVSRDSFVASVLERGVRVAAEGEKDE